MFGTYSRSKAWKCAACRISATLSPHSVHTNTSTSTPVLASDLWRLTSRSLNHQSDNNRPQLPSVLSCPQIAQAQHHTLHAVGITRAVMEPHICLPETLKVFASHNFE